MTVPTMPHEVEELRRLPSRRAKSGWYSAVAVVSLIVSVPIFIRLTASVTTSDIMAHAHLAKRVVEGGSWLSYTLWYVIIYAFSGGATDETSMRVASVVLLAITVAAKSVVVLWLAHRVLGSYRAGFGIALAMLVVSPLVDPAHPEDIYLGQITSTVWHNSTNILAAPLAILAFVAFLRLIRHPSWRNAIFASLLMVASVLAKPNFALAFLPAVGIILLAVYVRQRQPLLRSAALVAIAFIPPAIAILSQYLAVYGTVDRRPTHIRSGPLLAWEQFSDNIPLSIALSFAGPVVALFAMSRQRRRSLPVVLSWAVTLVAVIQLALFVERYDDGTIDTSGNWFWGSYSAMMILFIVSFIEIVRAFRSPEAHGLSIPRTVALVFLSAHVVSGLYYALTIGTNHFQ